MNADTLSILERLVAFPTVSSAPNLALVEFAEAFLRARGFAVTRLDDPGGEKAGLCASIGPAGAGVLLSAHSDVVPVAGQDWSHDPFRLTAEGDRVYGRGTTDMKGFLASMLALADRAAGRDLAEPLKLVISYDEEIGCVGMSRMIDRVAAFAGRPRLCIVGEPTEMRVATGHKGKHAFRAVAHGRGGHSALAPRLVNALHLATDLVGALRSLQDWLAENGARDTGYSVPFSTVHVGRLAGGDALNMVPERAELEFEFRVLPDDDAEALQSRIAAAARDIAARYKAPPIAITPLTAYPGFEIDPAHDVVRLVDGLAGGLGTTKVPFGTEAGFLAGLDIPTVVCGPGSMEGQGHKVDEYITRDQLAACDAMLGRLLDTLSA